MARFGVGEPPRARPAEGSASRLTLQLGPAYDRRDDKRADVLRCALARLRAFRGRPLTKSPEA